MVLIKVAVLFTVERPFLFQSRASAGQGLVLWLSTPPFLAPSHLLEGRSSALQVADGHMQGYFCAACCCEHQ